MALAQQVIGNDPAQHAADKPADRWQRGNKAGLEDGHAAILHQVHREPGQKEISDAINAALTQVNAEHHAIGQQLAYVVPLGAVGLFAFLVHVDHAAVVGDVFELRFVDARVLTRAVDHFEPDAREDDAEHTHHDKDVLPTVGIHDPAHQRCKQHGGKVLRRVENS